MRLAYKHGVTSGSDLRRAIALARHRAPKCCTRRVIFSAPWSTHKQTRSKESDFSLSYSSLCPPKESDLSLSCHFQNLSTGLQPYTLNVNLAVTPTYIFNAILIRMLKFWVIILYLFGNQILELGVNHLKDIKGKYNLTNILTNQEKNLWDGKEKGRNPWNVGCPYLPVMPFMGAETADFTGTS